MNLKSMVVVWMVFVAALSAVSACADEDELLEGDLVTVQPGDVVINEIMWAGKEYLELYNTTDSEVSLSGWRLLRQKPGEAGLSLRFAFEAGEAIEAGGYFLVEAEETATEVPAQKIKALGLVDDGALFVLQNELQEEVDRVNRLDDWFAGENIDGGISMERNSAGSNGTEAGSWHSSVATIAERKGTPGAANSEAVTPSPSPSLAPSASPFSSSSPNQPPTAEINIGQDEYFVGEEIDFSGENSTDPDGDDLSFSWTFGDDTSGSGAEVAHKYSSAGTYEVVLTASDGDLEAEARRTVTVKRRQYLRDILINEMLPNPVGTDKDNEFVELYNRGGDEIDLDGWKLVYNSTQRTISDKTIGAGAYLVFHYSVNNGGGTIKLLDPNGEEASVVTYPSIEEGESWSREDDGDFTVSTTDTPGEKNVITEPSEDEEDEEDKEEAEASPSPGQVAGSRVKKISLVSVRNEEPGTVVMVEGAVSAAPGTLGKGILYLAGSGVQVYMSKNNYLDLAIGDVIRVTGTVANYYGETRLKVTHPSDVKKLNKNSVPTPHEAATGEVGEDKEGWLVVVSGNVTETSGSTFYIDDGSGEVKVYIKPDTGIKKPKMKKGMAVTVVGIVSETSSGYRILPRTLDDIKIGGVAGLKSFPKTGYIFSSQSALWLLPVAAVLLMLGKQKKEPLLF